MLKLQFLAIGDIVTEPFIKLKDAKVSCDIDSENCTISMRWGDKIPYESAEVMRAVGNSANAAVAASRLGLASGLVSDIGDDSIGAGNVEHLTQEGVATEYVRTHPGMKSNYHYVLWYESERTILVHHEAYPYQFPELPEAPEWLYLSSLSEESEAYHGQIAAYLEANPGVKLAFQPGTFQIKLGIEKLARLYAHTVLLFCNKEEAKRILGSESTDVKELMQGLRALGPTYVVVTDNRNGAHAYDGETFTFVPMYPDSRAPFERTGAGDAFASTVTSAMALGKTFKEALLWGPVNSMAVVQEVGAQNGLLSREKLLQYLADAPQSYQVTEV